MEQVVPPELQLTCRLIGETELLKNLVIHLMASQRDPAGVERSLSEAGRSATAAIYGLLGTNIELRSLALGHADSLATYIREALVA